MNLEPFRPDKRSVLQRLSQSLTPRGRKSADRARWEEQLRGGDAAVNQLGEVPAQLFALLDNPAFEYLCDKKGRIDIRDVLEEWHKELKA